MTVFQYFYYFISELKKDKKCVSRLSMDRRRADNLRTLKRVHIGGKHDCKQCGKCFSRAGDLRRHETVHTGEKSYECKECGKCFSESGNLRKHERAHTGEKPHECKQCGKCFQLARSLRIHERVHTGEKPHECKHCGKCFAQAGNLKMHEDSILERSLMNANIVTSVLLKQEV